jgi:hypothetical protein
MKEKVVQYRFSLTNTFPKQEKPGRILEYVIQNIEKATLCNVGDCFYNDYYEQATDENNLLTIAIILTLEETHIAPAYDYADITQSVLAGLLSLCCTINQHSESQYDIHLWDFSSWNY